MEHFRTYIWCVSLLFREKNSVSFFFLKWPWASVVDSRTTSVHTHASKSNAVVFLCLGYCESMAGVHVYFIGTLDILKLQEKFRKPRRITLIFSTDSVVSKKKVREPAIPPRRPCGRIDRDGGSLVDPLAILICSHCTLAL